MSESPNQEVFLVTFTVTKCHEMCLSALKIILHTELTDFHTPLYTSTGEISTLSYARGLQQWFDDGITFFSD